ncbi:MAG: ABC transporter permease [Planctomycetes bacterium]|nr:ABC transporter permease [Planctomycetota bacterium]
MVIEHDILTFFEWLLPGAGGMGALLTFFLAVALLSVFLTLLAYLFTSVRHGPFEAFYVVAKSIATGVSDVANTSPRRVLALARLAVTEAVRRKVLIAFVVFLLILLFAGWFLDVRSDHPGRLYISFVLTATNYLVLLLALFLAAFSLPNDIKNRTIYTVVTKPVRGTEIILGRVLGFATVGTALLAMMCLVSYLFVVRGLDHGHAAIAETVEEMTDRNSQPIGVRGETTLNSHHRHTFEVDADGYGRTDAQMGHWHEVLAVAGPDGATQYEVGPPQGQLLARVPIYSRGPQPLRFRDRSGQPAEKGISVGDFWTYRDYIEGGSQARAVWTFQDITAEQFPAGLPVEMTLGIFRTHKGDIEQIVRGELEVVNPETEVRSEPISFRPTEFEIFHLDVPRDIRVVDPATQVSRDGDLFEDLVAEDGSTEIWVRCADPGQYYGMSRADLYLLAAERPFFLNFVKGYVSIWLQMVVVICFGVMFSAFLSGAVAMMATLATIVMGFFSGFIVGVFRGVLDPNAPVTEKVLGGGPIESFYRLITQKNVSLELDPSIGAVVIQTIDKGLVILMRTVVMIIPDFGRLGTANYVAYGFNIDGDLLAQHGAVALAYAVTVSLASYFFFKSREIAA